MQQAEDTALEPPATDVLPRSYDQMPSGLLVSEQSPVVEPIGLDTTRPSPTQALQPAPSQVGGWGHGDVRAWGKLTGPAEARGPGLQSGEGSLNRAMPNAWVHALTLHSWHPADYPLCIKHCLASQRGTCPTKHLFSALHRLALAPLSDGVAMAGLLPLGRYSRPCACLTLIVGNVLAGPSGLSSVPTVRAALPRR